MTAAGSENKTTRIAPHEMPVPPPVRRQKGPRRGFPSYIVVVGIPATIALGIAVFERSYHSLYSTAMTAAMAASAAQLKTLSIVCTRPGYACENLDRILAAGPSVGFEKTQQIRAQAFDSAIGYASCASVIAAACFLMLGYVIHKRRLAAWRRFAMQCVKCGYSTTGNVSGICPECGERI